MGVATPTATASLEATQSERVQRPMVRRALDAYVGIKRCDLRHLSGDSPPAPPQESAPFAGRFLRFTHPGNHGWPCNVASMFSYPAAHRSDVVDDYHGTAVADPYRWLEDPDSDATREFVAAQNDVSLPYLRDLPDRQRLIERMTELWDVPRTYLPTRRGETTIWAHNDGLQNQPVYYVSRSGGLPEVFLDPNLLSDDGTVAINVTSLSPDGSLFTYSIADAGSDWQVIRIRDTANAEDLTDVIRHVKHTSIAWTDDGFYYSRFPEAQPGSVATARNPSVCFHRLGTDQSEDVVVHNNGADPDPGYDPTITHDGRYLVLAEHVGTSAKNGVLFRDLTVEDSEWMQLVDPLIAVHTFVAHIDGEFIVASDLDAPNGQIIAIPLDDPSIRRELVAEGAAAIEAFLGGRRTDSGCPHNGWVSYPPSVRL